MVPVQNETKSEKLERLRYLRDQKKAALLDKTKLLKDTMVWKMGVLKTIDQNQKMDEDVKENQTLFNMFPEMYLSGNENAQVYKLLNEENKHKIPHYEFAAVCLEHKSGEEDPVVVGRDAQSHLFSIKGKIVKYKHVVDNTVFKNILDFK